MKRLTNPASPMPPRNDSGDDWLFFLQKPYPQRTRSFLKQSRIARIFADAFSSHPRPSAQSAPKTLFA